MREGDGFSAIMNSESLKGCSTDGIGLMEFGESDISVMFDILISDSHLPCWNGQL